jgi:hypothetical protein
MSTRVSLLDRYRVAGDPLRSERRVELIALAVTALLLLQLLYSVVRVSFLAEPEPIAPSLDSLEDLGLMQVVALDAAMREEIVNRPLFWPGRQPLSAQPDGSGESAAAEGAKQSELDEVKLVGVFGGGDSAGIIALVKGKKRRILLGGDLNGWTLESVEPGAVVFANGERHGGLTLEHVGIPARTVSDDKAREQAAKSVPMPGAADQADQKAAAAKVKKAPTLSAGPR